MSWDNLARRLELAARLDAVNAIHTPDTVPCGEGEVVVCRVCVDDLDQHVDWPCATRRATGGSA